MNNEDQDKRIYVSMRALSEAQGLPVKLLKMAKASGAPGFRLNNNVSWAELKPWLDAHRDELETKSKDTLEHFKIEIAKRDVVLRDLSIAKARKESLDPKEVKEFLKSLGIQLSALLISKFVKEAPPKVAGASVNQVKEFNEKAVREIWQTIQGELGEWTH